MRGETIRPLQLHTKYIIFERYDDRTQARFGKTRLFISMCKDLTCEIAVKELLSKQAGEQESKPKHDK